MLGGLGWGDKRHKQASSSTVSAQIAAIEKDVKGGCIPFINPSYSAIVKKVQALEGSIGSFKDLSAKDFVKLAEIKSLIDSNSKTFLGKISRVFSYVYNFCESSSQYKITEGVIRSQKETLAEVASEGSVDPLLEKVTKMSKKLKNEENKSLFSIGIILLAKEKQPERVNEFLGSISSSFISSIEDISNDKLEALFDVWPALREAGVPIEDMPALLTDLQDITNLKEAVGHVVALYQASIPKEKIASILKVLEPASSHKIAKIYEMVKDSAFTSLSQDLKSTVLTSIVNLPDSKLDFVMDCTRRWVNRPLDAEKITTDFVCLAKFSENQLDNLFKELDYWREKGIQEPNLVRMFNSLETFPQGKLKVVLDHIHFFLEKGMPESKIAAVLEYLERMPEDKVDPFFSETRNLVEAGKGVAANLHLILKCSIGEAAYEEEDHFEEEIRFLQKATELVKLGMNAVDFQNVFGGTRSASYQRKLKLCGLHNILSQMINLIKLPHQGESNWYDNFIAISQNMLHISIPTKDYMTQTQLDENSIAQTERLLYITAIEPAYEEMTPEEMTPDKLDSLLNRLFDQARRLLEKGVEIQDVEKFTGSFKSFTTSSKINLAFSVIEMLLQNGFSAQEIAQVCKKTYKCSEKKLLILFDQVNAFLHKPNAQKENIFAIINHIIDFNDFELRGFVEGLSKGDGSLDSINSIAESIKSKRLYE